MVSKRKIKKEAAPPAISYRVVVHTGPATYGVFSKASPRPEALFSDALDARIWAAMRDVLAYPGNDGALFNLNLAADTLLSCQTTPLAKVKRS